MREKATLKSLEQVKAFAHPLRLRLLEAFSDKPKTAKQAAEVLRQPPTKLYHHVEALERAGLIKLVRTQKKRGTLEKYYRTVANQFAVDSRLFRLKGQGKDTFGEFQAMFASMLDTTISEVNQSIKQRLIRPGKKECEITMARTHVRTTQAKVTQLKRKIRKLLDDFKAAKQDKGEAEYGLTVVFYPVVGQKKKR